MTRVACGKPGNRGAMVRSYAQEIPEQAAFDARLVVNYLAHRPLANPPAGTSEDTG
jgi:hypothetical protein